MGKLEVESKKRTQRTNLKKIILGTIATAGVLGVAVVAPNVLSAMGKLGILPLKRQKEFIRASRDRLIKRGLIRREKGFLRLTSIGEKTLRKLTLSEAVRKPQRWDGKWRVLIFDIPEQRKALREKVRSFLLTVGFVHLQHSVWIYPYDCEDLIVLVKADLHVGKEVLYMIVDSLENDSRLLKTFNLRR